MNAELKHIPPTLLDDAVTWYVRLNGSEATDADVKRHTEWLLQAPAHLEAYEGVALLAQEAGAFEAAARSAFAKDFSDAKTLPTKTGFWQKFARSWSWPQYATSAAALAALLFAAVLPNTTLYDTPSQPRYYVANSGGVDAVKLSDGSRVSMVSGTEMTFTVLPSARIIDLAVGRAFFDVVSDKSKPFYVNTGARQIKVVGTRFEVVRAAEFDRVAVREGLVSVAQTATSKTTAPILIEPGTVIRYNHNDGAPILSQENPSVIGAWKEGVLVFKAEQLSAVVSKINKLFPGIELLLGNAALEETLFSGTLVVSDTETMARQLADFLSLHVTVTNTKITLAN